jgi:hypothetical protein
MIERLEIRKGAPSGCGKDFSVQYAASGVFLKYKMRGITWNCKGIKKKRLPLS